MNYELPITINQALWGKGHKGRSSNTATTTAADESNNEMPEKTVAGYGRRCETRASASVRQQQYPLKPNTSVANFVYKRLVHEVRDDNEDNDDHEDENQCQNHRLEPPSLSYTTPPPTSLTLPQQEPHNSTATKAIIVRTTTQPQQATRKHVSFSTVTVHYHSTIIGDHPLVTRGVALTMEWKCLSSETLPVPTTTTLPRPRKKLRLSSSQRHLRLRAAGVSLDAILRQTADMEERRWWGDDQYDNSDDNDLEEDEEGGGEEEDDLQEDESLEEFEEAEWESDRWQ
mmetsp:Transcript_14029/g.26896  ORF Transcript_14029/g.26896 Transcript_14029/m.26896 type:complete len:286 (-) Transcript_14029:561-1418(-)|eukprot:scaffold111_cov149-Amphora_coffeaeformis.AAC.7